LRTPLEIEKIITQRDDSRSNSYKPNLYWIHQFEERGWPLRSAVNDRLAIFSRDYDNLIEGVANDLIRVRSAEKPKGLFDLKLTSVGLRILAANIRSDASFESFLDRCFATFWDSVDDCLQAVRDTIDSSVKPLINQMFAQLQADITEIALDGSVAELSRSILLAQTGAQQAIDRVKDWFRLSQAIDPPQFTFEEMVDVGLQCVKTIHPSFDPIVSQSAPVLPPFADSLTLFSDIFFVVFDNIRRHSGIAERPRVRIEVAGTCGSLRIVILNEVSKNARTAKADEKVGYIKALIASGEYLGVVSSEGGTGLIKIRKSLGVDAKKPVKYDFGFDQAGEFFVDFEIRTREITL
jgi:hypothetical protein